MGGLAAAALGGLVDCGVDLGNAPIDVGHDAGLHCQASLHVGRSSSNSQVPGKHVLEMGATQEAVDPDRVERHQDHHEGHQGDAHRAHRGTGRATPRPTACRAQRRRRGQ
jgi:hypothetical protein